MQVGDTVVRKKDWCEPESMYKCLTGEPVVITDIVSGVDGRVIIYFSPEDSNTSCTQWWADRFELYKKVPDFTFEMAIELIASYGYKVTLEKI